MTLRCSRRGEREISAGDESKRAGRAMRRARDESGRGEQEGTFIATLYSSCEHSPIGHSDPATPEAVAIP
eukprot:1975991-Rhodomonas_salina.1